MFRYTLKLQGAELDLGALGKRKAHNLWDWILRGFGELARMDMSTSSNSHQGSRARKKDPVILEMTV